MYDVTLPENVTDYVQTNVASAESDGLHAAVREAIYDGRRLRMVVDLRMDGEKPLLTAMESPAHEKTRERLFRYDATIRGLLYISGFLHFEQPLHHLICDVLDGDRGQTTLAMRFLRASYDYFYDEQGAMVLLHPGLAEPERVIGAVRCKDLSFEMNETVLAGAISGAFPEEIPLCEMMLGLLRGAVRPEISEEEAVEDLRMLAKQGVSLAEMNEVLSSLLAVLPTPDMLEGVRLIYQQTPRWALMKSAVMH